jgi:outer membrane protein OmpA-like peptidoglycan-associated protein
MSISDLMAGLMLVFLFIAIGFMIKVESKMDDMKEVAESYVDNKANLNEVLYGEFEDDLKEWDAVITKDNRVIFNSPEVLFKVNQSSINKKFKTVLDDFFPRYVSILTSDEYIDEIYEVRVEGHTSDTWAKDSSQEEIYLNNMRLSQSRAFEVLSYCYSIDDDKVVQNRTWLEKNFRANGMAFSKLKEGEQARRVEFTLQMKSEDRVYEILE